MPLMSDITQSCHSCSKPFIITEWEQNLLRQMALPLPTLCIDERHQRRLAFRNERSLYRGTCHKTDKSIISMYSPEKKSIVYSAPAWWSDKWDPLDYGREFDFNRPFFEQFAELQAVVPRIALFNAKAENSDFCNITAESRNCYLCFGGDYNENCYHSTFSFNCKDVCDSLWVGHSQLLYECMDSNRCFEVRFSRFVQDSKNCDFMFDCLGCESCLGCVNLRQKNYHIFNEPYTPEEYKKKKAEYQLNTHTGLEAFQKKFAAFRLKFPHRASIILHSEDSTGDNMLYAKRCINCFDVDGPSEDMKDSILSGMNSHHVLSCDHAADGTAFVYEVLSPVKSNNCAFCIYPWSSNDCYYCDTVYGSHDCFGCISLNHKQFCILNKQYSEGEYKDLKTKIIERMGKTGEWGQFFQSSLSPFGYNETVANEFYPLNKTEALQKSFQWSDYSAPLPDVKKIIPANRLPETIAEIPDDVLNWAIQCEVTGKPFKIVERELRFYRQMDLPVPHKHPDVRHVERVRQRNPRQIWSRSCSQCHKDIQTTYAPDRPEIVVCDECFLTSVY